MARRRRGARLERDLLRATWDELASVGYANLTMERVAARARTSKPVLYRRWPNRAALVLAVLRDRARPTSDQPPDTGILRGDVLALLGHGSTAFGTLGEVGPDVVRGLTTELEDVPVTDAFLVMRAAMGTILQRAVERGEAKAGPIPERVLALPGDLLRHEILTTHAPVPERVLVEIVDEIFLPLVQRAD
jgi:AcrR family transcriptional regulator